MYEYECKVIKVVDGDTLNVFVNLGFDEWRYMTLRLAGINAPELHKPDGSPNPEGVSAKNYVSSQLAGHATVLIRTHKDQSEKYGRYLAWVHIGNAWLNQLIAENCPGTVSPFEGLGPTPT